eukprot:g24805.t1
MSLMYGMAISESGRVVIFLRGYHQLVLFYPGVLDDIEEFLRIVVIRFPNCGVGSITICWAIQLGQHIHNRTSQGILEAWYSNRNSINKHSKLDPVYKPLRNKTGSNTNHPSKPTHISNGDNK